MSESVSIALDELDEAWLLKKINIYYAR
jgi:hypothetical protein